MGLQQIKEQIYQEYLSGKPSMRFLSRKYGYHHATISSWIMGNEKQSKGWALVKKAKTYEPQLKDQMPSDVQSLQEALYLAQVRIQLLEATIDIADEQLGANIRKKAGTRQS
jgi:transposase-like protein